MFYFLVRVVVMDGWIIRIVFLHLCYAKYYDCSSKVRNIICGVLFM